MDTFMFKAQNPPRYLFIFKNHKNLKITRKRVIFWAVTVEIRAILKNVAIVHSRGVWGIFTQPAGATMRHS